MVSVILTDFQLFHFPTRIIPEFWKRTIQGVAHPSLVQFGLVVLEKKIKMLKDNGQQTTSDGKNSVETSTLVSYKDTTNT
jgi:hypothetical protein